MRKIAIETSGGKELIDITTHIEKLIGQEKWRTGIIFLHVPHTTAALTINENTDPDVRKDIIEHMKRVVPKDWDYRHREGNSDAHILSSIFGCGLNVIVEDGILKLGPWQGIFFSEFDGPRKREVWAEFMKLESL